MNAGSIDYEKKWTRYVFWFVFFVVFPAIVIVQNLSFFFFILLFATASSREKPILVNKFLQWIAIAFAVGAIISVWDLNVNKPDALSRALVVLPNYIYWVVIILFFVTHREKLNYEVIYRAVFLGVICSIVHFFLLQRFLNFFPFAQFSENSFAFLLICYAPITVYYCLKRYGFSLAVILGVTITLAAFVSGSRAGSILTFFGVVISLFIDRLSLKTMTLSALVLFFFGNVLMQLELTKNIIRGLNTETFDLIYDRENVLKTDRSFLVRVAMVEKGLEIYKDNPLTGIGLNNFSNIKVKIPGDFEGAIYVKNKDIFEKKSAHNSYIALLAEGGLLLLVPFLILLIACIMHLLVKGNRISTSLRPVFLGILGMSGHLYFITAIVNVFAWLLLAIAIAIIYRRPRAL